MLWLQIPEDGDAEAVYEAALRERVLVSPSTLHAVGGRRQQGVRLTFCHASPEELVEGARRLTKALHGLCARPPRVPRVACVEMYGV